MTEPENNKISLWSDVDADTAIEVVVVLYGKDAATDAAWCALGARQDSRKEDYRFKRLTGMGTA